MADDVDIASSAISAAMEETLSQRRSSLLADEAARKALEGRSNVRRECNECGENIPMKRLLASPRAIRCAPCQEEFELGGR